MTAEAQIPAQVLAPARHSGTTIADRSAVDILIEKVALKLLTVSQIRTMKNQRTHERVAL